MKMAHDLGKVGYVEGVRGRTGGIRLARPAACAFRLIATTCSD